MMSFDRAFDIQPLKQEDMTLHVDGIPISAAAGETVLTVLQSIGLRQVARNDHGRVSGAYCGMGVCHCCLVKVNDRYKRRACQTLVQPNMRIETLTNRIL